MRQAPTPEDYFDDETEDAADHEDPEQVEEVELDIARAFEVAPEHAARGGLAVLKVAQVALQLALLVKRGVDGNREGDEDDELHARADELGADALQHHEHEDLDDGRRDKHVRHERGAPPVVAQQCDAKHHEGDGVGNRDNDADGEDDDGEGRVEVDAEAGGVGDERPAPKHHKEGEDRRGNDAVDKAQHTVDPGGERQLARLFGRGSAGVEVVAGQVVIG